MYTDIQLESIKLFGRKELSKGLIVYYDGCYKKLVDADYATEGFDADWVYLSDNKGNFKNINTLENSVLYYQIIKSKVGHIPHLEDLFRVAIEKGFFVSFALQSRGEYVLSIYGSDTQNSYTYTPILPLLDQPSLPEIVKLFS